MKKFLTLVLVMIVTTPLWSQVDSTLFRRVNKDTSKLLLNLDAVYNRPFLSVGKTPVALGGYVEANWQHLGTDGLTEGHQFQMKRLTLFVASGISRRIKFLSEIEFEGGTKEINIEFASIDFEFHPLLNFRGGVVMNPIGAFNQNHDGPKWEFIDRPTSATQLLPATWSNVGFGIYGKKYSKNWAYAYELYLTNGFDDQIISNTQNKTYLPATKLNRDRFEESFNGEPLITTKIALRNKKVGELGVSYMGGVYNKFQMDGLTLDKKRRVDVWALDFNTVLPIVKTYLVGEWAFVNVDVPDTYTQKYGNKQSGGFLDIVQPVIRRNIFNFNKSVVNVVCRFEYVDWNVGKFKETGGIISEDFVSIVPGISWRPTSLTVLRLNYRYNWTTDILGNPPSKTAGFQFGFSSYF
ncbi:MAG: hypothetical protein KF775_13410 [Cyclobacteriaceae bacterium]|jgi:hypothetical protein|nr:hypothetical protein [Cyclobacteriaceae bacterium]